MSRIKILVLIDWYLPGYKAGGPIQSVANIISHLEDGFDFSVITSDTDLHESKPYDSIDSNEWNILDDGTHVFYISHLFRSYSNLKRLLLTQHFDIIYLNSFFSKYFTVYPLLILKRSRIKCKIVIAPRGMLGEGALQIKAVKKMVFINAVKLWGLFDKVTWHASTSLEGDEIRSVFGEKAHVIVALNLSRVREISVIRRIKEKNCLKLVFLSRISPKKNLIAVHRYLSAMDPSAAIVFDYYGPVDDREYFDQCVKLFLSLPENIKVNYGGTLEPSKITATLSKYHFSILPTFNENFGHSIVDSWVAGCPVIISDQTPWKDLEQKKCGWDLALNDESFRGALRKCCLMEQNVFDEWSDASYKMSGQVINNPEAIEQNRKLFSL